MKAVQLTARETLTVRDLAVPRPGSGDLLLRVRAAGLCDTDLHIFHRIGEPGRSRMRAPLTLGHEFVGEVVEIGAEAAGFALGDRVAVEPNVYCGVCPPCRAGRHDACVRLQTIGMTRDGAFAEFVVVPAAFAHRLPDSVSYEVAGAFAEPLACVVHGYRRVRLQPGEDVLIVGDGFFGFLFAAVARARGAERIVVLGHHESRMARVRRAGADAALDERSPEAAEVVGALGEGLGPAVVIDTVGSASSVGLALGHVGPAGRIGVFGSAAAEWQVGAAHNLLRKGAEVLGLVGNPGVWPEALELLAGGAIDTAGAITHVLPLEDLPRAFELKASRDDGVGKIIIRP